MAWLRGAHSGPTRGELNGSQIRGQGAAPTRWRVDIDGDSDSDDEGPSKPRSQGNFSIDTSVDSKAGDDAARPLRSATDSVMGASDFDRLIEQSELEVSSQPTEPGEAGDEAPGAFNTLQLSAVSRNVDDAAIRRVFAQEMQIRRVSESRVLLHFHDDTSGKRGAVVCELTSFPKPWKLTLRIFPPHTLSERSRHTGKRMSSSSMDARTMSCTRMRR